MKIFRHKKNLAAYLELLRGKRTTIGFVPTMGALHDGHMTLVKASQKENKVTVCSIFVNPTQFNEKADFEQYPRDPVKDLLLLESRGCDVVFLPDAEEMYKGFKPVKPDLHGLDKRLEGAFRPGHFDGVVQVVYLLLMAVKPDSLYMGLKDFQQQAIVQMMIRELNLAVILRAMPTGREPSGLARSSRNERLSVQQRTDAAIIYRTLESAREGIMQGESIASVVEIATAGLQIEGTQLEYFKVCDASSLEEIVSWKPGTDVVIMVAIWWGDVRLIDNILISGNKAVKN